MSDDGSGDGVFVRLAKNAHIRGQRRGATSAPPLSNILFERREAITGKPAANDGRPQARAHPDRSIPGPDSPRSPERRNTNVRDLAQPSNLTASVGPAFHHFVKSAVAGDDEADRLRRSIEGAQYQLYALLPMQPPDEQRDLFLRGFTQFYGRHAIEIFREYPVQYDGAAVRRITDGHEVVDRRLGVGDDKAGSHEECAKQRAERTRKPREKKVQMKMAENGFTESDRSQDRSDVGNHAADAVHDIDAAIGIVVGGRYGDRC